MLVGLDVINRLFRVLNRQIDVAKGMNSIVVRLRNIFQSYHRCSPSYPISVSRTFTARRRPLEFTARRSGAPSASPGRIGGRRKLRSSSETDMLPQIDDLDVTVRAARVARIAGQPDHIALRHAVAGGGIPSCQTAPCARMTTKCVVVIDPHEHGDIVAGPVRIACPVAQISAVEYPSGLAARNRPSARQPAHGWASRP